MTGLAPGGRSPGLHLGLIVPVLGYVLVAPPALFLLPLGALGLLAGFRHREPIILAVLAGGFAAWWLSQLGTPPEQVLRGTALLAAAAFAVLSAATRLTLTHRALLGLAIAGLGVTGWVLQSPVSWNEIAWWVQYRATAMQVPMMAFLLFARPGSADEVLDRMETMIARFPDAAMVLFPAMVGLQVLVGLLLAAWVAHRLGFRIAAPVGSFTQFRFSEHLGWFGVLGLAILLLAPRSPAALVATNVVVVFAVLYGARGAAVLWYGLRTRGRRRWILGSMLVVSAVLLWQASAAALVILGVLDTGLDIRKRWLTPRQRGQDGSHTA